MQCAEPTLLHLTTVCPNHSHIPCRTMVQIQHRLPANGTLCPLLQYDAGSVENKPRTVLSVYWHSHTSTEIVIDSELTL